MEKIIFFGLALPILGFVLFLGGSAIMNGFSAKAINRPNVNEEENQEQAQSFSNETNQLSDEINKLNDLLKNEVLTQEEFEKAKKKILDK